jgi:hypothetical protein
MGPKVAEFEKAFADYHKSKYCVMVNSGSSANFLMIAALFFTKIGKSLKQGDEVIVPDPGFVSYYSILNWLNVKHVPVQLREELGFTMKIEDIEKAITPRTKMIIINSPNNPTGGVVTYNYQNKKLFTNENGAVASQINFSEFSGYTRKALCVQDNYTLVSYRSINEASSGKYNWKFVRYTWKNGVWKGVEFDFPYAITENDNFSYLHELETVFSEKFYGFLYLNRDTNRGELFLFNLKSDGVTWNDDEYRNIWIEDVKGDPVFMQGSEFVAIAPREWGPLRTYTLKNDHWNYKEIGQTRSEYFYGASNNFILVLDEDGQHDNIGNVDHDDVYYIHYLNEEKNWVSKSWTQVVKNSGINGIIASSYWYPNNTMATLVADSNQEFVFRWDDEYNLIGIDTPYGAYNDLSPAVASSNSLFNLEIKATYDIKSVRYDGNSWKSQFLRRKSVYSYNTSYGDDLVLSRSDDNSFYYGFFNANTNSWEKSNFNNSYASSFNHSTSAIANKFFIAGNELYSKKRLETGLFGVKSFIQLETLTSDNLFSYSNGLDKIYVKEGNSSNVVSKSSLYGINKETGSLDRIDLAQKENYRNNAFYHKLGGYTPFLSRNTVFLRKDKVGGGYYYYVYRIIDGKINNSVRDVVVTSVEVDNGIKKYLTNYYFDDYNYIGENTAYYGNITIEKVDENSQSNGKTIKYFNNGKLNTRLIGMPTMIQIKDADNNLKSETVFTNELFQKTYSNDFTSHYVRTTNTVSKAILTNGEYVSSVQSVYDSNGMLYKSIKVNTNEEIETSETTFATGAYFFDNNIIGKPENVIQKKGDLVVATTEIKYKEENGKVYPYQNWSGVTNMKLQKEVTKVDDKGRVLEENNGKGIYSVNLMGYNNQYPVAEIGNATYNDVIADLEVSYAVLQTLATEQLKTELLKLYDKMPKATFSLAFYDENGNVINKVDSRKEELYYYYDTFNRLSYTTDGAGNKLQETEYHFKE